MGKALKMGPVACTWWREEPVAAGKALLGGDSLFGFGNNCMEWWEH